MSISEIVCPLFVPADRPERFEKAAASGADAVILDLEDAVAADRKSVARDNLRTDFGSVPIWVRINGAGSICHADDLDRVAGLNFAGIIVPKAESPDALDRIAQAAPGRPLVALIESAQGLANARTIGRLACVARLAFGSIDYAADLGCAHTIEALLSARSELVLASRLAGIGAPLDGVTASLDDPARAESDAQAAQALGFGGKLAIHPKQVAPIRAGFRPRDSEIAWAHAVLSSGDGAARVDGAMIDEPVRIRARTILARASG